MKRIILRFAILATTFAVGITCVYFVWFAHTSPDSPRPAAPEPRVAAPAPDIRNIQPPTAEARERPIEEDWRELTRANFCFFGSNMYSPEREAMASVPMETGAPFSPYRWLPSLRRDEPAGVAFLIRQIPDKSRAAAHVDPFDIALKGELAVYCLQHIMKVNWYELKDEYRARLDRAVARDPGEFQGALLRIIKNKRESKEMMGLWVRRYEQLKQSSKAGD